MRHTSLGYVGTYPWKHSLLTQSLRGLSCSHRLLYYNELQYIPSAQNLQIRYEFISSFCQMQEEKDVALQSFQNLKKDNTDNLDNSGPQRNHIADDYGGPKLAQSMIRSLGQLWAFITVCNMNGSNQKIHKGNTASPDSSEKRATGKSATTLYFI